jgi:hypothetical protein
VFLAKGNDPLRIEGVAAMHRLPGVLLDINTLQESVDGAPPGL